MPTHLFVRTGPDSGEIFPLNHDVVIVGRSKNCSVRLSDPFVSRQHFRMERRGERYMVFDLGSANRVSVNGLPTNGKELTFGDEIRVGSTRLVFMKAAETEVASDNAAREATLNFQFVDARFEMAGTSPAMLRIYDEIQRLAPLDITVLIQGESGTGKELVAQAIHRHSKRASGPLVAINCAAIARELIESELFGHEKGAFTGAHTRRLGKFELAHRGTLFLDEVGELSLEGQAKLLRVLEEKRLTRLGGQKDCIVDVRIVAASNRDLRAMVKNGTFRQDLLFRLEVVRIKVPALRERKDDIPALSRHFLSRYRETAGRHVEDLSPGALARLAQHDWPGNVRELKNAIERAVIFSSGSIIEAHDLALQTSMIAPSPVAPVVNGNGNGAIVPIDELIRKQVQHALEVTGGNKKKAAEMLGIPRSSLYGFLGKAES